VFLEEAEAFDVVMLQEEDAEAKAEAEGPAWTDNVHRWVADGGRGYRIRSGVEERTDLGGYQVPHGPRPGSLRCGVRRSCPRAGISIGRICPGPDDNIHGWASGHQTYGTEEPGPGQQYPIQARKHIAALRRARPGITIEIRWCPAHQGITGNEKADEWAKIAAEKPCTRGVKNPGPLPRSLASLKREISEKAEARSWAGGRISKAKYRMAKSQKPDSEVANRTKRLASRFYQLKTGHARIGQYLLSRRRSRPLEGLSLLAHSACVFGRIGFACVFCLRVRKD